MERALKRVKAITQGSPLDPQTMIGAQASSEQSNGVGQISDAMGMLNQTAQQSASASEELAATAAEMGGQAQALKQVMGFFVRAQGGASG